MSRHALMRRLRRIAPAGALDLHASLATAPAAATPEASALADASPAAAHAGSNRQDAELSTDALARIDASSSSR